MRKFRNYYKREDKDALNQITELKIGYEVLKRAINKKKRDTKKRVWTIEEYNFLKDNWGKLSKKEIAAHLNRSIQSVSLKATRIGLFNYFVYSEEITLNQLHRIIYKANIHSSDVGYIWESYQMPFNRTVPCKEAAYRTIKMSDFLKWFEQNKRVINLYLTEEGCFGVEEPEWLKIKRIADKKAAVYGPHNRKWTSAENAKLIKLVNSQKYGYREISITLKRTEGAIKRQMLKLKLEKRPLREGTHNMWKETEIETVRDLWLKGYQSCVIAEYLPGRSALAINGLLERYQYFGEPPRKNQVEKRNKKEK